MVQGETSAGTHCKPFLEGEADAREILLLFRSNLPAFVKLLTPAHQSNRSVYRVNNV